MADESNGKLDGIGRADAPSSWKHTRGLEPDIDLTWHHVIPLRCLTTVWNGLVEGEHWSTAERFLHVAGADNASHLVEEMKAGRIGGEERDVLHEHVTWQGWNIVEGPGGLCRSDDPGDQYERFHWTSLSGNQRATLMAVSAIYSEMGPLHRQLDRAEPRKISSQQAKSLSDSLSTNRLALRKKAPIPFSEGMWDKLDPGRAGKRKPRYRKKAF
ncbi:hypothetical protein EV292_10411 [Sphingomonas sp. BK235]|nr:hypothetical protein EV292_10411 [Sphingomonas sp. BK235]